MLQEMVKTLDLREATFFAIASVSMVGMRRLWKKLDKNLE
jgi:hypothetical protein